jgi:hypothetical protein
MAMSGRSAAERFRNLLAQRNINIQIQDELVFLFQAMIDEIKQNMEATGVESPSEGYTVTVPNGNNGTVTVDVDGTSISGKINKGSFR